MEQHIQAILQAIEPDHHRPELQNTPKRASEALQYLTQGYKVKIEDLLKNTLIPTTHQQLILIKDIEFYSLCEHHLLPFFGKCHIAYTPNQYILGLSKFAEIMDVFARRLQIQENLCHQVANCLYSHLQPKGLAVIMEANHLCMKMRGIEKQGASLITQVLRGEFENPHHQNIIHQLIKP